MNINSIKQCVNNVKFVPIVEWMRVWLSMNSRACYDSQEGFIIFGSAITFVLYCTVMFTIQSEHSFI